MADLTHRQLALCVAGIALALVLGLRQLGGGGGAAAPPPGERPAAIEVQEADEASGRVVVHVAGAVRRPGVYKLAATARVDDAVAEAGGPTRRADLGGLNLAAEVEDGRQVLVPERAPSGGAAAASGSVASAAGSAGGPTAAGGPAEGQPVNLNTATLEQLDTLSGIGPLTAQKILDFREERGGFGSVEELGEIPGIGDQRLATLREEATL
jgi:competence protein ComEA